MTLMKLNILEKGANKVDEIINSENELNIIHIKALIGNFLFPNKTSYILK